MPETPTVEALLAEAYTWYSASLRDLVQELLDDAALDTASDTVDDLCGDLWLHAAELAVSYGRTFTELLDTLEVNAEILVGRLHYQPSVTAAGRLDTAADTIDVAEIATNAIVGGEHRPFPRSRPREFEHPRTLNSAA